ncbi:Spindle assembly abnormal protein 6 [Cichlidogyrus casuarinus]|uniref:Spindle assembly abnormal protein 6 n=1 Tax=Cichlidogyrus casuarinus TaxID=1844966 RepID=A0ABD2Q114_9PLAT
MTQRDQDHKNEMDRVSGQHALEIGERGRVLQDRYLREKETLISEYTSRIEHLQADANDSDARSQNMSFAHESLRRSHEELQQELARVREGSAKLEEKLEQISELQQQTSKENVTLVEKLTLLSDRLDEAKRGENEAMQKVAQKDTELQSLFEQSQKLERDISGRTCNVTQLEKLLETQNVDICKSNEIIAKLQTDLREFHSKSKTRGHVITEQEKVLSAKDQLSGNKITQISEKLSARSYKNTVNEPAKPILPLALEEESVQSKMPMISSYSKFLLKGVPTNGKPVDTSDVSSSSSVFMQAHTLSSAYFPATAQAQHF